MNIKPTLLLLALASTLAGCGGSGGGSDPVAATPTAAKLETAQGFWSGSLAGGTTLNAASTQAVLLPDGTAWMVLLSSAGAPTGMVKASLAVAGTGYVGSGHVYTLATGAAGSATMTGTAQAGSRLDATLTTAGATTTTGATGLAFSNAYYTAATAADVAGNWSASASSGALRVNWTVAAGGALSGISSTGCTWTGSFANRTGGTAVLDFSATETCAGVSTVYSGVAVPNSTKSAVTLFVTTTGDAQGFVLTMAK